MALVQAHFRGRMDSGELNSTGFAHPVDVGWTQRADEVFRVRFEVEGTGTLGGTLEAKVNAGSWFPVTTTSGTVTASPSENFLDGDATTDVIYGSSQDFVAGTGSTAGAATAVALTAQHTELEYAARLVPADVSNGGTVSLRIGGVGTYAKTPALIASYLSARDRVRLKIGDNQTEELLTDAEIDSYVASWPSNIDLAAADAAEAIAAKYSRGFTFSEDGQSFNRRERVVHYMDLAAALRKRGGALVWPTAA